MERKLISMTEYVLEQEKDFDSGIIGWKEFTNNVINYAKFLSQPLTIGMFVPTDEDGNVLLGKPLSPATDAEWIRWENEQESFSKARDRVLFEGFKIVECPDAEEDEITKVIKYNNCYAAHFKNNQWHLGVGSKTIEDLIYDDITLSNASQSTSW